MPFDFSNTETVESPGVGIANTKRMSKDEALETARLSSQNESGWFSTLVGVPTLAVADLADTVVSSLPGSQALFGMERGSLNAKMLSAVGLPGLNQFYENNKDAIEIGSGIYGIIGAELVTKKVSKALSPLIQGLKTMPYARRIAAMDDRYDQAMFSLRAADTLKAQSGLLGAGEFTAALRVPVTSWSKDGFKTVMTTIGRDKLTTKALATSFGRGVKNAAATELVMLATLNTNEFLYDADWGQNALWMGVGLGLGGAVPAFQTGYSIRKFAQSDMLNRMRAEALDPTGLEQKTLAFGVKVDKKAQTQYLGALQGTRTDEATSLMTQAMSTPAPNVDTSTWNKLRTSRIEKANLELNKAAQIGILGQNETRAILRNGATVSPEGRAINAAILRDPGAMLGVEMFGKIPDGYSTEGLHLETKGKIKTRIDKLEANLKDPKIENQARIKSLTELKQLRHADKTAPFAIVDGELLPLSHAKAYDNWIEPVIKQEKLGDDSIFSAVDAMGKPLGLGVDDRLTHVISGGKAFDDLDHFGKLGMFRAMKKSIDSISRRMMTEPKFVLDLPQNPHWTQLDAAEKILEQTKDQARISWPGGLTRESAQVESFAQKIEAMQRVKPEDLLDQAPKLRVQLNLPRLSSYEMGLTGSTKTALDVIARGVLDSNAVEDVRKMSLAELKKAFVDTKYVTDLGRETVNDVKSLSGNSFEFMLDNDGNHLVPMLAYRRSLKPREWVKDNLAERIAISKFQQAQVLTGAGAGQLTKTLTQALFNSADVQLAAQVNNLADIQAQMNVPGLQNVAPQSAVGTLAKELNPFSSTEFANRGNKVIQAVSRVRGTIDSFTRDWMKRSFEGAFGESLQQLSGPGAAASRSLLDQFHTPGIASGWDLEKNTIKLDVDGKSLHGFVLADTAQNKVRFQQQFGRAMLKGQELIGPSGKPVVLDDMALDIQQRLNVITNEQRVEKNTLNRSNKLREITYSPWYVPPPSLAGKFVSFVIDSKGEVVQGGTIIADTEALRQKAISRMKADPQSVANQTGNVIRGREEIQQFASALDRAQLELIEPGSVWTHGGATNTGKLGAPSMVTGSFTESLKHVRENYLKHGTNLLETLFSDQIAAAQARSQVAKGSSWFGGIEFKSIHDTWLGEIYGKTPVQGNSSIVGKAYNLIEDSFNSVMAEKSPAAGAVWHAMTDWATKRIPWGQGVADKEQFAKLAGHLGKYMPFDSLEDMITKRDEGAKAWTLGELTGAANQFTATWLLRMVETAHPIMNLGGIINAMPAVVRQFTPRAGETIEEFSSRVGHSASIFTTAQGKTLGAVDMGKLASRGFKRTWNLKGGDPFIEYATRHGMLSQEVAEFQRQWAAAEVNGTIKRFISGDPKSDSKFMQKGLVGWASVLSDKSEDFSRSWAHNIGLDLAEQLGIRGIPEANNFAHDLANKMIANYNPRNRPAIFQGAVGAPLGLFQSYMANYWQRMFGYIEQGEYKTLAVQAGMQAGMFGLVTLPGFEQINNLALEWSEGERSPKDSFNQDFGELGDLMAYGTISNIPKLFGAEGVDLWSRGDTQARSAVFEGLDSLPAVSVITKVKEGIGDAIDLFSERNPKLTTGQVGEVLSNTIPSRPIAGMVESLLTGGRDTDSYGQLVSETASAMETVYRVMGLRSMRMSKDLDAFYQNKQMMDIESGHKEVLRESSRALMREGRYEELPAIFETYLDTGGDPNNFKRWYMNNLESATDTRSQNQLEALLKKPEMAEMVDRLTAAGVSISDEEDQEDPFDSLSMVDSMDEDQPLPTEGDEGLMYGLTQ